MANADGEPTTAQNVPTGHLPSDMYHKVLQHTNVRTILSARSASSCLRGPASSLIDELVAEDALLSSDAWRSFPQARKLHIIQLITLSTLKGTISNCNPSFHANLLKLIATLPARLQHLVIQIQGPQPKAPFHHFLPRWGSEEGLQACMALAGAAISASLRSLLISYSISTTAAGVLLASLPALEALDLRLLGSSPGSHAPTWRPTVASTHLTSLKLATSQAVRLDLASLSDCTNLRSLCLEKVQLASVASISRLASLQSLRSSGTLTHDGVQHLASLQALQQLHLPSTSCTAEAWRILASLPDLREATLEHVSMEPPFQRCTGLTSLVCDEGLTLVSEGAAAKAGWLAELLPRLRELRARSFGLRPLAQALAGHGALRSLHLQLRYDPDSSWPARLLSRLPALEQVVLMRSSVPPDALLGDLAQCARLSNLTLVARDAVYCASAAGLAALASGPASQSLQLLGIKMISGKFSVRELAVLLKGSMPRLRSVRTKVALPPEVQTEADVVQQLPCLLREQGAVGKVRVVVLRPPGWYHEDHWQASCEVQVLGRRGAGGA